MDVLNKVTDFIDDNIRVVRVCIYNLISNQNNFFLQFQLNVSSLEVAIIDLNDSHV